MTDIVVQERFKTALCVLDLAFVWFSCFCNHCRTSGLYCLLSGFHNRCDWFGFIGVWRRWSACACVMQCLLCVFEPSVKAITREDAGRIWGLAARISPLEVTDLETVFLCICFPHHDHRLTLCQWDQSRQRTHLITYNLQHKVPGEVWMDCEWEWIVRRCKKLHLGAC